MAGLRPSVLRTPVLLVGAVAMTGALINVASAATPGSLSLGSAAGSKSWTGKSYAQAVPDPALCLSKAEDPGDATCDHLALTVTGGGKVDVSISWSSSADDFDLYVYKGDTLVASSATGGSTSEKASISPASGAYEVRVVPYLVDRQRLLRQGGVRQARRGAAAARRPGAVPRHPDPRREPVAGAAEPRDPADQAAAGAQEHEHRAQGRGADDRHRPQGPRLLRRRRLRRPRRRAGRHQDPPVGRRQPHLAGQDAAAAGQDGPATLDPYIYVEENSGRVFDLDLLVASSALSFSDDGGETWQGPFPTSATSAVNDHQTLFAGPPPAGFDKALLTDPKFQEILYYCFNRVADSSCTRSFDGGRTFTNAGIAYPGVNPDRPGVLRRPARPRGDRPPRLRLRAAGLLRGQLSRSTSPTSRCPRTPA